MRITKATTERARRRREEEIERRIGNAKLICATMGIATPTDRYLREEAIRAIDEERAQSLLKRWRGVLERLA